MSQEIVVQDIYIYPIKSLSGIRLEEAQVEEKGFQWDRRWMLVDRTGRFLSQRKYPQLALLKVELTDRNLLVCKRGQEKKSIEIPLESLDCREIQVSVWDDDMLAQRVSDEADLWFSQYLGFEVFLVKMPVSTQRLVDPKYAIHSESVSFADGMPYLLISQESLDDLNSKLDEAVPMNRFRPNLVFKGMHPYQEDMMGEMTVGKVRFQAVKLCARCVMTTVDQVSGEAGKEPLRTLSTYRKQGNKVMFGQNMVVLSKGKVRVGDAVQFK